MGAEDASLVGDVLVLLAAMCAGAYAVLSMPLLERYSPLAVAAYPTIFGGPVLLLLSSPYLLSPFWGDVGLGAWAAVAYAAVFATAFTFACLGINTAQMWWFTALVAIVLIFVATERGQFRTTRPKASFPRPVNDR